MRGSTAPALPDIRSHEVPRALVDDDSESIFGTPRALTPTTREALQTTKSGFPRSLAHLQTSHGPAHEVDLRSMREALTPRLDDEFPLCSAARAATAPLQPRVAGFSMQRLRHRRARERTTLPPVELRPGSSALVRENVLQVALCDLRPKFQHAHLSSFALAHGQCQEQLDQDTEIQRPPNVTADVDNVSQKQSISEAVNMLRQTAETSQGAESHASTAVTLVCGPVGEGQEMLRKPERAQAVTAETQTDSFERSSEEYIDPYDTQAQRALPWRRFVVSRSVHKRQVNFEKWRPAQSGSRPLESGYISQTRHHFPGALDSPYLCKTGPSLRNAVNVS